MYFTGEKHSQIQLLLTLEPSDPGLSGLMWGPMNLQMKILKDRLNGKGAEEANSWIVQLEETEYINSGC